MKRLFPWWSMVDRSTLRDDALAGLVAGVLVLPQAIAFAALAGLPPQFGLYAAVLPCVVAALAGSSRHVMSGPANATSLALFAMLSPLALPGGVQYIELALAVTIVVGALELAVGVLRLGLLTDFISPSVLLGFMCGTALLIAIYALRDFLGLSLRHGTSALELLVGLISDPSLIRWQPAVVGIASLASAVAIRRFVPRIPHMLVGIIVGYAVAWLFNHLAADGAPAPVAVVGPLPSLLPHFERPAVSWTALPDLLGVAAALTIVSLAQSISIAKAIALRSGQDIDANREFIGQGLANLVAGLSSSFLVCGSTNRSMANYEAGARTPLASVFSAIALVALIALLSPWLAGIPMPAIAAMLMLVARGLFDANRLRRLARSSRIEFAIALVTLIATLVLRLEIAVLLGTLVSLMVYLYQTSRPAIRALVPDADDDLRRFTPLDELRRAQPECPQLKLLRIEGAIYFGAEHHVSDQLRAQRQGTQKHLLAMTKSMNFIDFAGVELWDRELKDRRAAGGDLYFHRPRRQVLEIWRQSGFLARLGDDHLYATKQQALTAITARLDPHECATCRLRIFTDCVNRPGADQAASAAAARS